MSSGRLRVFLLAVADFLAVYMAMVLLAVVYREYSHDYYSLKPYFELWPFGMIFVILNSFARLYHGNLLYPGLSLGPVEELRRMSLTLIGVYLVFSFYVFMLKQGSGYSRFVILASIFIAVFSVPLFRWIVRSIMKRAGIGNIKAVILGAGHTGRLIAAELKRNRQIGLEPVGFLDDREDFITQEGIPLLGKLSDAKTVTEKTAVKYAVFCLPVSLISSRLKEFSEIYDHILIVPDNKVFPAAWSYPYDIDGIFALELRNQLLLAGPRMMKRILETVMAFFALLTLWPLFLILAFVIKLSNPGPIFYRAKRVGLNGKMIYVLKFRTMYQDADKRLEDLLESDPLLAKEWEQNFKLDKDPRITKVGAFLRKTSLDELPQFWNVLTGEMSIIGPRPIVEAEKGYYGENYEVFKRVKPGITGLWQVSGRSNTSYERRVNLDMHYIMNWSVWMDYYIFLKTIKEVLFCHGAK